MRRPKHPARLIETAEHMRHSKSNCLPATAAVVLAAVCVLAWSAGLLLVDGHSWPLRLGLLLAGLLLAAGSATLALRVRQSNHRAVREHFQALFQLDPHELNDNTLADKLPPLPENHPCHELAASVSQTLIEHCRRLQDVEHSRAALELRCRRAASQGEQIRAVLAALHEPIIAIDDFDELVFANPAAEALFDLHGENTEQRAVTHLVHCQKLVDLLTGTCHRPTAGNRTDELEIVDPRGRSQWYRVSAAKLSTQNDEADPSGDARQGAVAVLREIGHQKALQKRNAEFVSAVSHEMKTPLAGIKAYVELLVDGDADDEATREEFLQVINGQTDRLQRLIDNMLNLARIEAGVVSVNKQNRSLNELLEEAVNVVQPAAEAKQIQLVAELSPLYLGVLADRDMMLQAAINLLSNAVKYTPQGGQVTLRSRLVDDQVAFEVQDSGVGLSEEDCRRVFDKFYRVKKNTNMASGTGLGLPLAKHIVEDVHGGHLSVQSTLDKGSTFTVTLTSSGQMA